jgi:hypothetical protein
MHRRLVLALVAVLCCGGASLTGVASTASATGEGCSVTAEGPFLYHTTVFPVTAVECSTTQTRSRIVTSLTRDGVQVSSARRDCRKTSVCYLTFDASVADIPGDQQYCLQSQGYVAGNYFVGAASSCESEPF